MELAVIVMLIAVAFGILLVSTSMLQNQKVAISGSKGDISCFGR